MRVNPQSVCVDLGERSYSIEIGENLWGRLADHLAERCNPSRVAVITDSNVGPLYEPTVSATFAGRPWTTTFHRMPAGETHKGLSTVQQLYTEILDAGCDRRTPVVALGGGVPGDVAGFVAATLLRGLPYIQVPTTLLAMVDSSVGGKTGVDMPHGKNLIGAFYQPSLVLVSLDALATLPAREFSAGMAEVIKYGVIWDADLFAELESKLDALLAGDRASLAPIIRRCCEIKAEVVSKDERESGLREILNYGHTVGHAVEAAAEYSALLHGEAISIGMVVETRIAENRGANLGDLAQRLSKLFERTNLPHRATKQFDLDRLWTLMLADKKTRAGDIRMVLPTKLGHVETVGGVTRVEFERAWGECLG